VGASPRQIGHAVAKLEHFGSPEAVLAFAARQSATTGGLLGLGYEQRLAVEMAAHEDAERRALEGELATLEAAWREAETLAAIADGLLVPQDVETALARLRATAAPGAGPSAPPRPAP
jgi:hypothetical protein